MHDLSERREPTRREAIWSMSAALLSLASVTIATRPFGTGGGATLNEEFTESSPAPTPEVDEPTLPPVPVEQVYQRIGSVPKPAMLGNAYTMTVDLSAEPGGDVPLTLGEILDNCDRIRLELDIQAIIRIKPGMVKRSAEAAFEYNFGNGCIVPDHVAELDLDHLMSNLDRFTKDLPTLRAGHVLTIECDLVEGTVSYQGFTPDRNNRGDRDSWPVSCSGLIEDRQFAIGLPLAFFNSNEKPFRDNVTQLFSQAKLIQSQVAAAGE